jgi:hypothetical protein
VKIVLIVALLAGTARADDPASAFRAAEAHRSIDELEALGARRPTSDWTDDAWSEAARLAAAAGDVARERRDLEQVVATGTDPQLVRRAKAELDRLAAIAGAGGEWAQVAIEHERLEAAAAHGDPKPALRALEALVRANPGYPRANAVRLAIGHGWERDGDTERALHWYREAAATGDSTARIALVRALVGARDLSAARQALTQVSDPHIQAALARDLATAERRQSLRYVLGGVLATIVLALILLLRREAGSWRAVPRALVRPPVEALYLAPIGVVLIAIAWTGNPLVAQAIRAIIGAALAITWLSGASLEAARRRRPIGAMRALGQGLVAAAAVGCVAYLTISGSQLIDMAAETVREGPAPR